MRQQSDLSDLRDFDPLTVLDTPIGRDFGNKKSIFEYNKYVDEDELDNQLFDNNDIKINVELIKQ